MGDNIVNSVLDEMERNNPQLQYGGGMPPQGGGGEEFAYSPVQPQQQVRMGEVMYDPRNTGNQAPTMQNNMAQNMASEPMVAPGEEDMAMEAPDLTNYGMEEETGGLVDMLLGEVKGPLMVAVLVFVMSLPQVSSVIRNFVAGFTTNALYMNVVLALMVGVAYYSLNKVLNF